MTATRAVRGWIMALVAVPASIRIGKRVVVARAMTTTLGVPLQILVPAINFFHHFAFSSCQCFGF
jgi:hypothetical protein